MSSEYICIEGVIGAGKTTLAQMLAADLNAHLFLERFEDNSFLAKFYEDRNRYAFPLEMSFLADRFHQIQRFEHIHDEKITISDYYITKSRVFASLNLQGDEAELFSTIYNIMFQKVLKPDLLVYLHRPVKQLVENINRRGRLVEKQIDPTYIEQLQYGYLDFLNSQKNELSILVIDLGDRDFISDKERYEYLLKTIQKPRLKGLYRETV